MGNIPSVINNVGTVPSNSAAERVEFTGYDTYIVPVSTLLQGNYELFQKGTGKSANYQNFSLPVEKTVAYEFTHISVKWDVRFTIAVGTAGATSLETFFENNTFVNYVIEDKTYNSYPIVDLADANRVTYNGGFSLRERFTNWYKFQDSVKIGGDQRVQFFLQLPGNLTTAATAPTTNPYYPGNTGGALAGTEGFGIRVTLYGYKLRVIR